MPSGDANQAREAMADDLAREWSTTFRVRVDVRRPQQRWKEVAMVDVLHAGEDEREEGDEVRRDELVDQVIEIAEDAGEEGPAQARIVGLGERRGVVVWQVQPWVVGEVFSLQGSPREIAGEATGQTMLQLARVTESMARHLDRAYSRIGAQQENAAKQLASLVDVVSGALRSQIDTGADVAARLREAALPAVELRRMDLEAGKLEAQHRERMEQDRLNSELLTHALDVIVAAYAGGGQLGGDASHCNESRTLAGVIESVAEDQRAAFFSLFTPDEKSALERASKCATVEEFDAVFGVMYGLFQQRGKAGFGALFTQIQGVIGPGSMKIAGLISAHEKRKAG